MERGQDIMPRHCFAKGNQCAKGHSPWNKGLPPLHPFPKGNKLSSLRKGKHYPHLQGIKFTEGHKKKISLALKGKPKSDEHKKHKSKIPVKIKCIICGKEFNVQPCYAKGRKKYCSIKCRSLSKTGKRSHWWRGGVTPLNKLRVNSKEWKIRRIECFERDKFRCQICGLFTKNLHAHHIVPWRISHNDDLINLLSVCNKCHRKIESKW